MRHLKCAFGGGREKILVFILLILVSLLGYYKAIGGPFLYDDFHLVVENRHVHEFALNKFFVTTPRTGAYPDVESNIYRPLSTLTYSVFYRLFGPNPLFYHLGNILFHALNGFLVFSILRWFNKKSLLLAILMSIIFLVHPVQAESVSYISGQPDILGGTFVLLGIFWFVKSDFKKNDFWKRTVQISCIFVISLLYKEAGVIFPALAVLFTLYTWKTLSKVEKRRHIQTLGVLFLIAGIYTALKFTILDFSNMGADLLLGEPEYVKSIFFRTKTFFLYFQEYIRLLFYPARLQFDKEFIVVELISFKAITGFVILLQLAYMMIRSFFEKRVFLVGIGWFFISLFPMSGILVAVNFPYAEHWLYIPLLGLILISHYLLCDIWAKRGKTIKICIAGFLILLITALSLRLFYRNTEWNDSLKFYEKEIELSPNVPRLRLNYGLELAKRDMPQEAQNSFLEGLNLSRKKGQPTEGFYLNLGSLYYMLRIYEESVKFYLHSLNINSQFLRVYYALRQVALHESEALGDETYLELADFTQKYIEKLSNHERVSDEELVILAEKFLQTKWENRPVLREEAIPDSGNLEAGVNES